MILQSCFLQVRDVKAARDEEKNTARENVEAVKMKHQREKAQELMVCVNYCA